MPTKHFSDYHAICHNENLKIPKSKNHIGHIYDQNAIQGLSVVAQICNPSTLGR